MAEVLAPAGVEGVQEGKVAHLSEVAARGYPLVVEEMVVVVVVLAGRVRGRGRGGVAVATEDAAEAEESVLVGGGLAAAAEGGLLRGAARVLLPVLHLLQEERGLLLVDEGEAGDAVFYLEGVEKGAILVVGP